MELDLSTLAKVLTRLEEGLARYRSNTADLQLRDGLVLRFASAFDQVHQALKHYLELAAPNPADYDIADFQLLIRSAAEQRVVLHGWPDWRRYRDMRSNTSHSHNEATALDVVAGLPGFLQEVLHLYRELRARTSR